MQLSYTWDGETRSIECSDTFGSALLCKLILDGTTYPLLPFIDDVQVVLDVGANCGAASTWFSLLYPDARVYAFEPGSQPHRLLARNVEPLGNVTTYRLGLHDHDDEVDLFHGVDDSGTASIFRRFDTSDSSERITLRSAGGWFAESGLGRLDVLKVDTEGCELPIFRSLAEVLADVKVIYLEFHSESDRREIDDLLNPTHSLYFGRVIGDEGEVAYVSRAHLPDKANGALPSLLQRLVPSA